MPQVLLTDIDGTLVDSNALHAESWRRALEHFGIETTLAEMWSQIGKGGDKIIPAFVPEADRERLEKPIKELRKELAQRDYIPRIVAFAKARDLLVRVHQSGMKIVIASSTDQEVLPIYSKIIGGEQGIDDLIEKASTSADAKDSKPDADIFIAALKKIDMQPEQAIALGDTPWDAQAVGKIGIPIIGLTCGGWKRSDLMDAGCVEVWCDPADLLLNFDKSALSRQ